MFKILILAFCIGIACAINASVFPKADYSHEVSRFAVTHVADFHAAARRAIGSRKTRDNNPNCCGYNLVNGVASFPLWDVSTYQLGKARYTLGFSNASTPINGGSPGVYNPNVLAVDTANQRFVTQDVLVGQYTDLNGSWQWYPFTVDSNGDPVYVCFYDSEAPFPVEQAKHRSSLLMDVDIKLGINVSTGNPDRFRVVDTDVYAFSGVTRDYGAGPEGWINFAGLVDKCDLKTYYFDATFGQGGPRLQTCPECIPHPGTLNGEYVYYGPGSAILDITNAPSSVWTLHPSCYVNGNTSMPLSTDLLNYQANVCTI